MYIKHLKCNKQISRKLWTKFTKIKSSNDHSTKLNGDNTNNKDIKFRSNYNNDNKSRKLYSPQSYCMENVKKFDYENYLTTLLIPESSLRRCAFAVRAFNVELAQIRDSTSHPTIAQMRIEFWSNVIDEIYNENNKNAFSYGGQPIAWEIKSIYKSDENKLSKHWFKKLINSRVDVCVNDFPFNSIQDLENYAESSVSPVYYLLIEYMNFSQQLSPAKRIQLDHIASHTGKAQGIVNMLRGIPFNAKANRCYVPNDLLVKHKISHEDFLRGKQSQNMNDVCYDIACMAKQHTEQAEQLIKQISSNEKLLFLPLYNIRKYLLQLEKYYFNVFHSKLSLRRGMLPLNLWFQSIKIRFGLRWFSNF